MSSPSPKNKGILSGVADLYPARLFHDFFQSEKAGGLILIFCTAVSLLIANSQFQVNYHEFWHFHFAGHSVVDWINDGLMAIFFLLIGLELEREVFSGQLSSLKNASLPFFAALGGMLVPATIFVMINYGRDTQPGAGIPMATDIAFAIGILSLVGKKIPVSLKVFLTALAVLDDLGAILIIAFFYTKTLVWMNLFISLSIFGFLIVLNRLKIRNLFPYLVGGVVMWYFMLHSGIHATITGVLLAFAIPFGNGDEKMPSYTLQHLLHKPVAFIILPLFALANTALTLSSDWYHGLAEPLSLGIIIGLFVGKPLGIYFFSIAGIKSGLCSYPAGTNKKQILGVSFLGGIGFTMSIFITILAFQQQQYIDYAKIAVLLASVISGITGYIYLKTLKPAGTIRKDL